MRRAILALALILAGTAGASAQGYGYGGYGSHPGYGYGRHAPSRVIVVPHRPVFAPPHRFGWYGRPHFRRNHGLNRRWAW